MVCQVVVGLGFGGHLPWMYICRVTFQFQGEGLGKDNALEGTHSKQHALEGERIYSSKWLGSPPPHLQAI